MKYNAWAAEVRRRGEDAAALRLEGDEKGNVVGIPAETVRAWYQSTASHDPAKWDKRHGLQFVERAVWFNVQIAGLSWAKFNVEYFVGVDGTSIAMILLTALISFICIFASWENIKKHIKGYFCMFLLLETGMMGVFCALDFFLFFIFWDVMLLPMYFLIGVWGGPRKEYAAIKFFLYTFAGGVLMLLAMIAIYYGSQSTSFDPRYGQPFFKLADGSLVQHTFNLMDLAYANSWSTASLLGMDFAKVIWVALFIGFAIKIPMFPFHTWLPDAHVEAPTAISVILAGILLKMGTYGIFRMNFPLFAEATKWASGAMVVFGAINILYGAFCAMAQKDLKKLVAYSSISHMGFCLLGMAAVTPAGMNGAMFQMFNHGCITAMLFLLVGVIYDRVHHRQIEGFGGLASKMPVYTAFTGFAFFAAMGLPGLSGFISEALVFLGAFQEFQLATVLSAIGIIITAAYLLWTIQRMFLGPVTDRVLAYEKEGHLHEINLREVGTLAPLAVMVIVFGFYPAPVLDLFKSGMQGLTTLVASSTGIMPNVVLAAVGG
ncbi:MAG: NADH-quinone oxidoreductase subunit M [Deltaproteobacteria bacterium]|nr:NADH-quinone oxidoreductase subunit M [Deltaproteobacteria bacterium]